MLPVKIVYHDPAIPELFKRPQGDWIDLATAERVELRKGEIKMISLGVSMQIPAGYEALVIPRSSTAKRFGVIQANSIGLIDESYCGDDDIWHFPALAVRDTIIEKGTRICQFRLFKHQDELEFIKMQSLGNKNRAGFGSTGN